MTDAPKVYPPWKPKKEPWLPPDYDDRVIYAMRALAEGKATEGQQRIIWRWLGYVTGVEEMTFRPGQDGTRDTDFAEGKRYVGLQMRKMLHPELTPPEAEQPKRKR